jgi:hypothetical protein
MVEFIIKGLVIANKIGQLLVQYKSIIRTTSELLDLLDINVTSFTSGHDGHDF